MAWSKPEWNEPMKSAKPVVRRQSPRGFSASVLIYIALFTILGVGGILWWESDTSLVTTEKPDQGKSARSSSLKKSKPIDRDKSQATDRTADASLSRKRPPVDNKRVTPREISAVDRVKQIIDAERQKKEAWRIADSNRLAKSEAILAAQAPRKFFDNEVDNTLEVVSKPGAQFLILPQVNLSQQEVLDYLKTPITISDDDDDETVAAKKRTANFKEQALDYIAKGGTINQFIREQAAAAADEREALDEIRREKDRLLINEGPAAAKAYLDKVNSELRELNIPEIRMGRADVSKLRHRQRMLHQQKQER